MRVTYENSRCAVIDDVLPPDAFAALSRHMHEGIEYKRRSFYKLRADGGDPLLGAPVLWPSIPAERIIPAGVDTSAMDLTLYPTGTPLDETLQIIKGILLERPHLVGHEGKDWVALAAVPYRYPNDWRGYWHVDGRVYAGAFAYYTHPRWEREWAGFFMVQDGAEPYSDIGAGIGHWVYPFPNRLCIVAGGTLHNPSSCDASLGENFRSAISGFTVRPEGVAEYAARVSNKPAQATTSP